MQMVKKTLLTTLVALVAILMFAPKVNLYFLLEQELQKNGIVLSNEKVESKLFGLDISNAKVYVENTHIGDVKDISILTLLLYNSIDIFEFTPVKSIQKMFPLSIKEAHINYAVWNPLEVKISADSSVGKIEGRVDLQNRKVMLRFLDKNRIGPIRNYLRRDKSGWYYEQSF